VLRTGKGAEAARRWSVPQAAVLAELRAGAPLTELVAGDADEVAELLELELVISPAAAMGRLHVAAELLERFPVVLATWLGAAGALRHVRALVEGSANR